MIASILVFVAGGLPQSSLNRGTRMYSAHVREMMATPDGLRIQAEIQANRKGKIGCSASMR